MDLAGTIRRQGVIGTRLRVRAPSSRAPPTRALIQCCPSASLPPEAPLPEGLVHASGTEGLQQGCKQKVRRLSELVIAYAGTRRSTERAGTSSGARAARCGPASKGDSYRRHKACGSRQSSTPALPSSPRDWGRGRSLGHRTECPKPVGPVARGAFAGASRHSLGALERG